MDTAQGRAVKLRPRTNCPLPGHGTRCEVARERRGDFYYRTTEKRLALGYERVAEGDLE